MASGSLRRDRWLISRFSIHSLLNMKHRQAFDAIREACRPGLFSVSLVLLRVALGVVFFFAGFSKLMSYWSAASFLSAASGPFAGFFQAMAGSALVDGLNAWGLTLIGVALILGVLLRSASAAGIILMLLYYFAHFEQNTAHGFVDQHIIYAIILLMLIGSGVGHALGLDAVIERARVFKTHRWLCWLFG